MKTEQLFNLLTLLVISAVVVLLIFNAVPDSNRENVSTIIGGLIGFLVRAAIPHKDSGETQAVLVTNDPNQAIPVEATKAD